MAEWTRLAHIAEVLPGERMTAWVDDLPILLVNIDGDYFAVEDKCTHEDFELSAGPVDAGTASIECVLHGARFDLKTGEALCAPAYTPVRAFPLKVEDDYLWADIS